MLNALLEKEILALDNWSLTVGRLLLALSVIVFCILAYRLTKAKWRLIFFNKYNVSHPARRSFEKYTRQAILLLGGYILIRLLHLDPPFYSTENISMHFSLFPLAGLILVLAQLANWTLTHILTHTYDKEVSGQTMINASSEARKAVLKIATNTITYIMIAMVGLILLKNFNLDVSLYSQEVDGQRINFRLSQILVVVVILLIARLIIWLITNVALYGVYKRRDIDEGSQFAVNQILKYVIYLLAIFVSLNSIGLNMTLLLGGIAALLVGVGLGLQQTFNDFFSGLVLLFERSISVGDILTIDGMQGTVKKIGMRASIFETLGNKTIVIPNSKLVNDNVVNWNHFDNTVRMEVSVGIAYGSDTDLVKKLLLQSLDNHPDILSYPRPFVRFNNFGESSLDFTLYFFSDRLLVEDDLTSDIRFKIDKLFRDNNITIPFPQMELRVKREDLK